MDTIEVIDIDNILKININDFLLYFDQYNKNGELFNKEIFIKIPDEFSIKECLEIKIPFFKKRNFSQFEFLSNFDKLPIKMNLEISQNDLMLLMYKNIKISFNIINDGDIKNNIYLLIYIDENIKYTFLVNFYSLNKEYEIYGINYTPSDNMMGLLNNIKRSNNV